jgi:hypothetical protein
MHPKQRVILPLIMVTFFIRIISSFIYYCLIISGITFTSKQIKPNERIYMKIIDVDETGQWLGSLAIGNT